MHTNKRIKCKNILCNLSSGGCLRSASGASAALFQKMFCHGMQTWKGKLTRTSAAVPRLIAAIRTMGLQDVPAPEARQRQDPASFHRFLRIRSCCQTKLPLSGDSVGRCFRRFPWHLCCWPVDHSAGVTTKVALQLRFIITFQKRYNCLECKCFPDIRAAFRPIAVFLREFFFS